MDILYSPGISFMNPTLARTAAPTRLRPWFYQETGIGPLTKVSKEANWSADRQLHPYSPVWKRSYKDRNIDRLGAFTNAMPNFEQLGEAPGPTAVATTMERNPLGFLTNMIARSGDIADGVATTMLQNSSIQAQRAQSESNATLAKLGESNTWLLLTGLGVAGVAAYFYFKK